MPPRTKRRAARVSAPTPALGLYRYVALVPPGVGARLSFDGAAVELGNGWVDLSARIAEAQPQSWLDAGLVGPRSDGGELLAEVLLDGRGSRHDGGICREWQTEPAATPVYWLRVDGRWWPVQRLDLPTPRADDSGPVGTIAEQLSTA